MNSIAQLREANNIKQLALAKAIGWRPNRLSQYENGKRKVHTSDATLIIEGFKELGVSTTFEQLFIVTNEAA